MRRFLLLVVGRAVEVLIRVPLALGVGLIVIRLLSLLVAACDGDTGSSLVAAGEVMVGTGLGVVTLLWDLRATRWRWYPRFKRWATTASERSFERTFPERETLPMASFTEVSTVERSAADGRVRSKS